jgi:hypothetical protein
MLKSVRTHAYGHILGHAVIVIAADGMMRMPPHPIKARDRFESIIDQIAKKQAEVVRLVDRLQGRPIGMNIGKQKNAHKKPDALENALESLTRPVFWQYTVVLIL